MNEDKTERIQELIEESDYGLSQREIAMETGFSQPTVRKYVNKLVENGEITVVEKGNMLIYLQGREVKS